MADKKLKELFALIRLDKIAELKKAIAAGADVNGSFDAGYGEMSALEWALHGAHPIAPLILLDAGADAKATDEEGTTALHNVKLARVAEALLSRGADVNAKRKDKKTPLIMAAAGELEVVEVLLAHGADVHAKDEDGYTAYASTSDPKIRELLKKHGAQGFAGAGGKARKAKAKAAKPADVVVDRGTIAVDDAGRVWFGSNNGLYVLDGEKIASWEVADQSSYNLVAAGKKGVVYVAGNGLLRFEGGKVTHFGSESSELFDNHIVSLTTDPAGRAYLLHYEGGADEKRITIFDGKTFQILEPGRDFPADLHVECVGFAARGELMIGGDGLAVKEGGEWKVVVKDYVYDVLADGDTLWIASVSGVIERRGGKNKLHEMALVHSVCKDGDVLWIGTNGDGLGRLEKGKLTFLTEEHGLPSDDVEGLTRGADGRVWLRSNYTPMYVLGGKLYALDGAAVGAAEPEPEPEVPLVPFPKTPLLAPAKLPPKTRKAIESAKLDGVTAAQLLSVVRPAIALALGKASRKELPVGASKLGGRPDLPDGVDWPAHGGAPLPFVLQIDLASIAGFDLEGLLPKKGTLSFFCDTRADEIRGARVVLIEKGKLVRRAFPDDLDAEEPDFLARLPELPLTPSQAFTLPSEALLRARARLTDDDVGRLEKLRDALGANRSRLLGWPDRFQRDVVSGEKQVSLLQLSGTSHALFDHWCSDGLIHLVVGVAELAKKKLGGVKASMET